jgi:ABC-2 type transport system ATP-binding protein
MRLRAPALAGCILAAGLAAPGTAPARDATVKSFDGTSLNTHFFPAKNMGGKRVPTVLVGPGWSAPGDTNPNSKTSTVFGAIGLGPLRRAGFNVLTWDPRGFGKSSGTVETDSPKFEGRDVSALIDFVAKQPEALLDRKGDPRVGMAGASYGGGIQLVTAASDRRVDAIVPDIAWNSLVTSLGKNETAKSGWGLSLYAAAVAAGGRLDPAITQSATDAGATFVVSPASRSFFATRGPGNNLVARIRVPTLLIQGTVDTLFTLDEAVRNYTILRRHHVPTKMLWFCGGHGVCITNPGNTARIQSDTVAWLERWLARRKHVRTGPGFEWLDQNGHSYSAPRYPLQSAGTLAGSGGGTLSLVAAGGSGPVTPPPGSAFGPLGGVFIAGEASNAVNVSIKAPARAKAIILGAPRLSFDYQGTAPSANARVLAQILDRRTHKVLGNQITPIPVTLDGASHSVKLPLEIVVATATHRSDFALQLVAQSALYNAHPQGGTVAFSNVKVSLPVVR